MQRHARLHGARGASDASDDASGDASDAGLPSDFINVFQRAAEPLCNSSTSPRLGGMKRWRRRRGGRGGGIGRGSADGGGWGTRQRRGGGSRGGGEEANTWGRRGGRGGEAASGTAGALAGRGRAAGATDRKRGCAPQLSLPIALQLRFVITGQVVWCSGAGAGAEQAIQAVTGGHTARRPCATRAAVQV